MAPFNVAFLLLVSTAAGVHGLWTPEPTRRSQTPDWASLKSALGGRLYQGVPFSEPCFSSYNGQSVTPDSAKCSYVQENFFNNHMNRSNAFGGYSATQFEGCMATGDQCQLNWAAPNDVSAFAAPQDCKQGSVPSYYIDVKNSNDVVIAFKFIRDNKGVPLVIKNTGHDFQGRSSAPGSLALWMHNLKYTNYVESFVPDGCEDDDQTAITYGAGTQFEELYKFADSHNVFIVGGSDQSVAAAGGFIQGGGHSPLSRVYGLGVDRVLQYKVVTADGHVRIANACQNSDLFYALRGGGGGTFGVVLEATSAVFPATSIQLANINWPVNEANSRKILSLFIDNATSLAIQGWAGYVTPSQGNLVLINTKVGSQQRKNAVKALVDLSTELGGSSTLKELPNYITWFQGWVQGIYGAQDAVGLPNALGSRLVPASNHETAQSRAQLLDAIMDVVKGSFFSQIHFTTPYGFNALDVDRTSVNPVWRTSLYQIINVNTWAYDGSLADKQAAYAATTNALATLRSITPNSGAYHNEADIHEPDYQSSFWGNNYQRLLAIKNKYDSNRLLDCWHCVGWQGASNDRFKCYI